MTQRNGDITHDLLRAIRRIVRRISEHSKHLSAAYGLTVPQLMCLKAIGELEEHAEITVAGVAGAVQLSPATVSRILDRLVKAGLVDRVRSEEDRRRVLLSLTAAGVERYYTLPRPLQEEFVERLMALDPAERSRLLDAVLRINELMEATDLEAAPVLAPGEDMDRSVGEDD